MRIIGIGERKNKVLFMLPFLVLVVVGVSFVRMNMGNAQNVDGDYAADVRATLSIKSKENGAEKTSYLTGEAMSFGSIIEINGENSRYENSYILVKVPRQYFGGWNFSLPSVNNATQNSDDHTADYAVRKIVLSSMNGGTVLGVDFNVWLKNIETPAGYNFDVVFEYYSQDGVLLNRKSKNLTTLKKDRGISTSKKGVWFSGWFNPNTIERGVVTYTDATNTTIDANSWSSIGRLRYEIYAQAKDSSGQQGSYTIESWTITDNLPQYLELDDIQTEDGLLYNPDTHSVSKTITGNNREVRLMLNLRFKNNTPESILNKEYENKGVVSVKYTDGAEYSENVIHKIIPKAVLKGEASDGVSFNKTSGANSVWGVDYKNIDGKRVMNVASLNGGRMQSGWKFDIRVKNQGYDTIPFRYMRDDISSDEKVNRISYNGSLTFTNDNPLEIYITNESGNEILAGNIKNNGDFVDVSQYDVKSVRVSTKNKTLPGSVYGSSEYSFTISISSTRSPEYYNNLVKEVNVPYEITNVATANIANIDYTSSASLYLGRWGQKLGNHPGLVNQVYSADQNLSTGYNNWYYLGMNIYGKRDINKVPGAKVILLFPQEMELTNESKALVTDGKWQYYSNYKNSGKSAIVMNSDFRGVSAIKVGKLMPEGEHELEMVTIWDQSSADYGEGSDDLDFHDDGNTTSVNVARSKAKFRVSNPVMVTAYKQVRNIDRGEFWSENLTKTRGGDDIEYRVSVLNYNTKTLTGVRILDILPYENDKTIVRNNDGVLSDRGSTLNIELTGPVIDESGSKFNILYSTDMPGANEVESLNKNFVTADQIADWSKVKMVKLEQKADTEILAETAVLFRIPAKIPKDAQDLSKAVNTSAVKMGDISKFNEGNAAAVTVEYPAVISGVAFQDKNSNSVYDSGDTLLKGYTVQLYNTDGTPVAGKTATTDDNGFYKIETYDLKKYYVQFTKNDTLPVVLDRTIQENGKTISTKDSAKGSNLADRTTLKSTEFTISKDANGRSFVRNIGVYEPKGTVKIKFQTEGGLTIKADEILADNVNVGDSYDANPSKVTEITKDNLVYVFSKVKDGSAPVSGNVAEGEQSVIYTYTPKPGSEVKAKYLIAGTQTELAPTRTVSPAGTQVGTEYTTSKNQELTDANGLVYTFSALRAGSAQETGRVTEATQTVTFDYVPKAGGSVVAKFLLEDGTEISTQETIKTTGTQVGTEYSSTPKNEIVFNGITYVFTRLADDSATQNGRVDTSNKVVKYLYEPKRGGQVIANFVDEEGNSIAATKVVAQNGTPVGTNYTDTAPAQEIANAAGLKFTFKERRNNSAPVSGKVTVATQEIVYVYSKKLGKGVISKFVDENGDEIASQETVAQDGVQVGTPYNATKPNEITDKDGLVYTFEKLADGSAKESGKTTEDEQTVVFRYRKKAGGEVVAIFLDDKDNELKPEVEVSKKDTQVGTKYESTHEDEITKDGLVYVFEKLDDTSAPKSGRVTEGEQAVIYRYTPKKGGRVIAKFVDENGNEIQPPQTIAKSGTQVGTPYESTTVKKISINGKNYILRKINGQEKGTVSEDETIIEYVFELEKSDILSPNTGVRNIEISMIAIAIFVVLVNGAALLVRKKYL